MPLVRRFPKNFLRPKYFYSLLLILVLVFLFGLKFAYQKIKRPDFYKPSGNISFVPPTDKVSSNDGEPVTPNDPGFRALLPGAKWVPQSFNNCGPATTSMVLQYFGFDVSQVVTKEKLRTNPDDKNVFTTEIADYIRRDYGVESKLFYGGNINLIKKLVANGYYVVVEDWLRPNEDIGHVTIIRGFDDEQGVLIADDSYIGVNITYPYEEFIQTQWKPFNYEYLPVYRQGNEALLQAIVGEDWDQNKMYQNAETTARQEIAVNDSDMYAWFNLGTNLFGLGKFASAKEAFEKSRSLGWPRRMLWYQIQPIQTYNLLGEHQKAIELADVALWGNDSFAEAHFEKAIAYKGLGDLPKARQEAEKALIYSPNFTKAHNFLSMF